MDQFSLVPFLIGLVVAGLFGAGSGLLAVRAAGDGPAGRSPIGQDHGMLPGLLFWLGFGFGTIGGLYGISSSNTWLGILMYLLIAAVSAAVTGFPSRLLRRRHNRAFDDSFDGSDGFDDFGVEVQAPAQPDQ